MAVRALCHSCIELRGLGVLSNVASMNHEVWQLHPCRDNIDSVDGFLQRPRYIRISALVESNVAIADLDEGEVLYLPNPASTALCRLRQQPGRRNSAGHRPEESRPCPCHAPQKIAPVDPVARLLRLILMH